MFAITDRFFHKDFIVNHSGRLVFVRYFKVSSIGTFSIISPWLGGFTIITRLINISIYWLNLSIYQNLVQKDLYQNLYNDTTQRSLQEYCLKFFLLHWIFSQKSSSNWQKVQIFRIYLAGVDKQWSNTWQFMRSVHREYWLPK